jgi:hypothetical protein
VVQKYRFLEKNSFPTKTSVKLVIPVDTGSCTELSEQQHVDVLIVNYCYNSYSVKTASITGNILFNK